MNREIEMYGMTQAEIREDYMESLTARIGGLEMVIAGVLSDCQELLAMGDSERVRKQLNVAKFMLFEKMIENREKSA